MAGFGTLSRFFRRRRKKTASSRRWAIKSKKLVTKTSCRPAGMQGKQNSHKETQMEPVVKSINKDGEQLLTCSINGGLYHAVGSIVQQWQYRFSQMWNGMWNVFLFWRVYSQRVEILHQKVEDLQKELRLLHDNLDKGPRSSCCHCVPSVLQQHHQSSVDPPTALPTPPLSLPPPPPPPPAPPLPPPPAKKTPQKLSLIPKKRTSVSILQEKTNRHVAVTLQDLQAVQLRKVTVNRKFWVSPERKKAPLVTLADLQKIRLKRTSNSLPILRLCHDKSPTNSAIKQRVQLKKVHAVSTPSGTPLCNKENVENICYSPITNQALENDHLCPFPAKTEACQPRL